MEQEMEHDMDEDEGDDRPDTPDASAGGVLVVPTTLAPEEIGRQMARSVKADIRREKALRAGLPVAPEDEEKPEDAAPGWLSPEEQKAWVARYGSDRPSDSEDAPGGGGFLVVPEKLSNDEWTRMNRAYNAIMEEDDEEAPPP